MLALFSVSEVDTVRHIRVERPREWEEAHLYVIADTHIEDKNHDAELMRKTLQTIKDDEHALVIINGDLLNTALRNSVSDIYGERMTLGEAIDYVSKMLEPIKDRIVAGTIGNHEYRAFKETSIDVMKVIFANLGIADRYMCEGGVVYIRFGQNGKHTHGRKHPPKIYYSIYVTHGGRGGGGASSTANALARMSSVCDADIYIHSHTHTPLVYRSGYYRLDPYNCSSTFVDRLYVNTAAMLDFGGYGQMKEYTPASKRTPCIVLNGRLKDAYTK